MRKHNAEREQKKLRLPKILGAGCVLQQGKGTRIWGWCAPGKKVTVVFQGQKKNGQADAEGRFEILLGEILPGTDFTLKVCTDREEKSISPVSVGEVLVCAGQSNMELPMERVREKFPEEFDQGGCPAVHIYKVAEWPDFQKPLSDNRQARWFSCTGEDLNHATALGYFLGKELSAEKGVPVGILDLSLGGTPSQAWTSREGLEGCPDLLADADQYRDTEYRERTVREREEAEQEWLEALLAQEKETAGAPWKDIQVPGCLSRQGLKDFCGQLYLKRNFYVEKEHAGKPALLRFGMLADRDKMYINGVFTGETDNRYPPRCYQILQGVLKEGENELLVKMICQNGDGRITPGKIYEIRTDSGKRIPLSGTWKYQIRGVCGKCVPYDTPSRKPVGLFQGMVAPCLPYTVKGVVWYQGESNEGDPGRYEELLQRLILDWRKHWKQERLPFVIIQLPGCDTDIASFDAWPRIRQAQKKAEILPDTVMTVNLDLGEANDLHPLDKKSVAHRAFLAVRHLMYGEQVIFKGPEAKHCMRQGEDIILEFETNAPGGLVTKEGETPGNFQAAGKDGKFCPIEVQIEKDLVRLFPEKGKQPEKIRYAWSNVPEKGLLYNEAGLPAGPFEIEI